MATGIVALRSDRLRRDYPALGSITRRVFSFSARNSRRYIAGRYRFADFPKIGSILALLIYGVAITLLPLGWRLK